MPFNCFKFSVKLKYVRALLISSIVTSVVKSQATRLQIGLAGKMGESQKRTNSMYSYGVCSSYTEYRPFKKSAAKAAVADLKMSGISNAADAAIADNVDADISSQNGRHTLTCCPSQSVLPGPLRG